MSMKPVIYLFIEFISPQLERVKTISNKINKRNTWTEWPMQGSREFWSMRNFHFYYILTALLLKRTLKQDKYFAVFKP